MNQENLFGITCQHVINGIVHIPTIRTLHRAQNKTYFHARLCILFPHRFTREATLHKTKGRDTKEIHGFPKDESLFSSPSEACFSSLILPLLVLCIDLHKLLQQFAFQKNTDVQKQRVSFSKDIFCWIRRMTLHCLPTIN